MRSKLTVGKDEVHFFNDMLSKGSRKVKNRSSQNWKRPAFRL